LHNEEWKGNFVLTPEDAKAIFLNNPGGHFVAKNEQGEIIGVVWCASLFAKSIEEIPGSLKGIMFAEVGRHFYTDCNNVKEISLAEALKI